jgi:hypothetical protein
MSNATTTKSLKGLTHKQKLAATDHFFTPEEGGPECFLLAEKEFHLELALEALEDRSAPVQEQRAVLAEIRAVLRSMEALGCTHGGDTSR